MSKTKLSTFLKINMNIEPSSDVERDHVTTVVHLHLEICLDESARGHPASPHCDTLITHVSEKK